MPIADVVAVHRVKDEQRVVSGRIPTQKTHVDDRVVGVGTVHRKILTRWIYTNINALDPNSHVYRLFKWHEIDELLVVRLTSLKKKFQDFLPQLCATRTKKKTGKLMDVASLHCPVGLVYLIREAKETKQKHLITTTS